MVLWDDVGGRTWTERAGPRAEIAETDARPRRRSRLRRLNATRFRPAGSGLRGVIAPGGGAPEGSR